MKKILFVLIAIVGVLSFSSCQKNNSNATAEITVKKSGKVVAGETVYQFSSQTWTGGDSFHTPTFASRSVVTDENGVATFELKEAYDLDLINDQTTLYYVTFNSSKAITGKIGVTIKKGETKQATINQ